MQEVIATYDGESGRHRARVFRISTGVYRIDVERLYDADDAGGVVHGVFWAALRGFTSYTDDPERATVLALHNLADAQAIEP